MECGAADGDGWKTAGLRGRRGFTRRRNNGKRSPTDGADSRFSGIGRFVFPLPVFLKKIIDHAVIIMIDDLQGDLEAVLHIADAGVEIALRPVAFRQKSRRRVLKEGFRESLASGLIPIEQRE